MGYSCCSSGCCSVGPTCCGLGCCSADHTCTQQGCELGLDYCRQALYSVGVIDRCTNSDLVRARNLVLRGLTCIFIRYCVSILHYDLRKCHTVHYVHSLTDNEAQELRLLSDYSRAADHRSRLATPLGSHARPARFPILMLTLHINTSARSTITTAFSVYAPNSASTEHALGVEASSVQSQAALAGAGYSNVSALPISA